MNYNPNMPIAPHAHIKHKKAWRRCQDFPIDATIKLISSHNPWRPGSYSWPIFDLLRKKPMATIEEILNDCQEIGYPRSQAMESLKWLYTWGDFIEINGQRYFAKQEQLPGEED